MRINNYYSAMHTSSSLSGPTITQHQTLKQKNPLYFGSQDLKNKSIFVTSSEIDMSKFKIKSEAGGMALATCQIADSLYEHLGMNVTLIVPAVQGVNVTHWKKELPDDKLISFEITNTDASKQTLYFQIFSSKTLTPQKPEKAGSLKVMAIKQVDKNGTPVEETPEPAFFNFQDFNFRTPTSREQGAALYKTKQNADDLKTGAMFLWNDTLIQAMDRLSVPDVVMFSNYADNELPNLLQSYSKDPTRYKKTALVHMIHAELGGPEAGYATDNIIAKSTEYLVKGPFEWLLDALRLSHATLINPGYALFLAERYDRLYGPNPVSPLLRKLPGLIPKTTKPLHLGFNDFDPLNSESSETSQIPGLTFQPLPGKIPKIGSDSFLEKLLLFKSANKSNLYTMLERLPEDKAWTEAGGEIVGNLTPRKDSTIFTYFDRIDSTKGTQWILDVIPQILKNRPSVQFIIGSGFTKAAELQNTSFYKQVQSLAKEFPGQFIFLQGQPDRKLLHAGSDFSLRPSLQETFGLGPLEAMSQGAVPIYYNDHAHPTIMNEDRGIPIQALPPEIVDRYTEYAKEKLSPNKQESSNTVGFPITNDTLLEALQKALALNKEEWLVKSSNSLIYANTEHRWPKIMSERFAPLIIEAMDRAERGKRQIDLVA